MFPQPLLLPQRPAVNMSKNPVQVEHTGPTHNIFGKIKVQINPTERAAVGRSTPRDHYSSQNMSKTCQSSVIKLFTSYIGFLFFSFFFFFSMGQTVYLGRVQLTLPMPGCCFGSPRLWSSEGCCTVMGKSTLAHALQ